MNQGISYKERLKSKKDTERLFKEGVHFFKHPVKALCIFSDTPVRHCSLLVTTSKKKFKRAVDRNRAKRLLREAYRLQKSQIYKSEENTPQTQVSMLALMYVSDKEPDFMAVKEAVKEILQKIAGRVG